MPTEVQIFKNGTVVADDLAADAVTTIKILDGNVTSAKLDPETASNGKGKRYVSASEPSGGVDGDIWYVGQTLDGKTITAAQIVDQSITAAQIKDNTITAKQLSSTINFVPIGGIIMWSGTITAAEALTGWKLCDGINGTPDLRNRFIVGAHSGAGIGINSTAGPTFNVSSTGVGVLSRNYTPGDTGGETAHKLTVAELASHSHLYNGGATKSLRGDSAGPDDVAEGYDLDTGSRGGDNYHENRPPYYALAFIMRVS